MAKKVSKPNKYVHVITTLFERHYSAGLKDFVFSREELVGIARELGHEIKNFGDTLYSIRYRMKMPEAIATKAAAGKHWIIEGAGRGKYRFIQKPIQSISPRTDKLSIKVPDSTPEIIAAYALSDEQALLAKVRYNRLIDIFLGITAFSLQNHLRSVVKGLGQIEIDEVYIGIDRHGVQYVIPVQAKGGNDHHNPVQTTQDIKWCAANLPNLICRAVSAQFIDSSLIALFELTLVDDTIKVVEERHYKLVPHTEISADDLRLYSNVMTSRS